MKKITSIFLLLVSTSVWAGSAADIVFSDSKVTLSAAEKESMIKQAGIMSDGTVLLQSEAPVTAEVRGMDLNSDGKPEVLMILSSPMYGAAGSNVQLFVKDANGQYKSNLGFPAGDVKPLATKTQGFQDLQIGGPGFDCPIWKWNGKEYALSHQVKCQ